MTGRAHLGTHSFWYRCCFMGFKETTHSNSVFSRRRICCNNKCCMSSRLDAENFERSFVEPTTIFCDNNSAIALSKNHVFHKRTKQFDPRFHFIRELVDNKEICLEFCKSEDQLADIFTKPLAKDTFQYLHSYLGMTSSPQ